MKKTIGVILLTACIISGSFFIPEAIAASIPHIQTIGISSQVYYTAIAASGEVEQRAQTDIVSELPLVVLDVKVRVGDEVEAGQTVLRVNKTATIRQLSELEGSAAYAAAVSAGLSGDEGLQEAIAQIPEELVAEKSGTVSAVNVSRGDLIEPNVPAVTTIQSVDLVVRAAVSEDQVAQVSVGQRALVTGSGFGGREYTGTVTVIYPQARKQYLGTVQETVVDLQIDLDAPDEAIKAGFTVTAEIETAPPRTIYTLSYSPIMQDDGGQEYVYVYENGRAARRDITTGEELADSVEIVRGLSERDRVIASPSKVLEGEYVRLR